MFYYRPKSEVETIYYDFHVREGRGAGMLPFIKDPAQQYLKHYLLMREFHRRIHPFTFLEEGQNAILAGCHDQFIDMGLSMLFIMSAIVGPQGHIWGIEPDHRNVSAVKQFVKTNKVENITMTDIGVWKEKGELEFILFNDFSSSNVVRSTLDKNVLLDSERIEQQTYTKTIQVDTIDSIMAQHIRKPVQYINLTINRTEPEAIQGAEKTIATYHPTIAFPLAHISSPLYETLKSYGYRVAVVNVHPKAWDTNQFLYGCATQKSEAELMAEGFVSVRLVDVQQDNRFFDIIPA